ncbi:MAG: hypothetical protein AAF828_04650 [Bacteroidota bacterium]
MIRSILKIAVFLVIAIIGYNYFLGDEQEKAQSREIVGKAADLGKDAWNLLRGEKEKFEEGKYNGAVDKLKSLYSQLAEQAKTLQDSDALDQISKLEEKRQELSEQLQSSQADKAADQAQQEDIKNSLEQLTKETEVLMNELEGKGKQ